MKSVVCLLAFALGVFAASCVEAGNCNAFFGQQVQAVQAVQAYGGIQQVVQPQFVQQQHFVPVQQVQVQRVVQPVQAVRVQRVVQPVVVQRQRVQRVVTPSVVVRRGLFGPRVIRF